MLHIHQDKPNNCGQTVVAMLTSASVEDVTERCGTAGKTRTSHLRKALAELGWDLAGRARKFVDFTQLPTRWSVLKVRLSPKSGHWVLYDSDRREVWDPSLWEAWPFARWQEIMTSRVPGATVTGFLPVRKLSYGDLVCGVKSLV